MKLDEFKALVIAERKAQQAVGFSAGKNLLAMMVAKLPNM